ncbi:MAG: phosphotransferase [Puniceicoccales bacterium]|jgi:aminoglycoside/choline kinase family phosphotransferase|nr:phosphotransferase [Puniceicoccales bacterium]
MPTSFPKEFADADPILKGGSGRQFFRVALHDGQHAVLCRYDDSREENALYADIADFLAKIGFPVPRVLARDDNARTLLLEDLGATDLLALRTAPAPERMAAQRSALAALAHLHNSALAQWQAAGPTRPKLMPAFDAALYRWEQDYFWERTAVAVFNQPCLTPPPALRAELDALAGRLLRLPAQLVHRDCQSQNILWHDGAARFIDFQGMRIGTGFYDLGSFLFDPYTSFSESERDALLDFYRACGGGATLTPAEFLQAFLDASAQRLMQALGAYGFLGLQKGRREFLAHIPSALANLRAVTEQNPLLPHLRQTTARF